MFKAILKGSVQLCLSNFDDLIKAAGAWTVVLILFSLIAQMADFGNRAMNAQLIAQNPGKFAFFVLVSLVIQFVAASSIAVAWHRFALLGERPATIHLRFGRPEWRYFLYSLLLGFFMAAVMLIFALVAAGFAAISTGLSANETAAAIIAVLLMIGFVFAAPLFARASLMLPAAAIDRPMGLFRALRFGKGFGWPMVFVTIVLIIPFILLDLLIMTIMVSVSAGLPQLIVILQFVLLKGLEQIVVTILLLSVVTITYAYAREREDAGNQPDD
ncbi:hypothetical protein C8N35_11811 [Breoghania corrubedonensis]|uniref:Uncharacterized protein n=1 Tax=Breoghania corrubedonensis TaxID=665038 RepID=A0A2T5UN75_9HYPH|nr:hypothetical protein [Breoghania corrubedonensis]PTW52954.1 hypothetical protein C8N35_11811 [Breoghania corrubedonensis]